MIPLFEHNVCNEIAMQGIGAHKKGLLAAMWLEMIVFVFLCIKLSEEGTQKVADVPTGVVQDVMLDHMGSDFRCQSRVMTTKNC